MKTLPWEVRAGASGVLLVLLAAATAGWLAPDNPLQPDLAHRLLPPSAQHWLGTDTLGRDEGSRLLYGARATLGLVALVAALMVPIGVTVGIAAGYRGGWLDRILTALTNLTLGLPSLILALAFVGLLGPGLLNTTFALVLTGWPAYARLARAQTRLMRASDYLAAAQMQGIRGLRLLAGHILPACAPQLQIRLALDLASIILTAAAFGFLGLGVRPPTPEWGMMIAEGSKVVFDQWWVATFPGAAVFLVSLSFNLIADGLRDRADPLHG